MKEKRKISKIISMAGLMLAMTFVHAGRPVWTLTPLTATELLLGPNDSSVVQYQVTNQSRKAHVLGMRTIPGVTQITTPGYCPENFLLGYHESCTLNLYISGSQIGNIAGGPVVCDKNNSNQCYQPSRTDSLKITRRTTADYMLGGSVSGLLGTVVIENNGADPLTLQADGNFTFPTALPSGSSYAVTVQSQPATQTCTVNNGSGTISNADVANISLNCSTNTRTVGGITSGLAVSESLILQNNGADDLNINANGSFSFSTPVAQGANYNVTILTQPATQTCSLMNASGTAGVSDINNIQVTCATNAYTVGGTLSGLSGTVVLQNNGADNLSLGSDGNFSFSTPVAQGASYAVTVLTQPAIQTCAVTNGSGIMGGSNVTNVDVTCVTNSTVLTSSVTDLALSVTGLTEYGISGTPASGVARIITITNSGSNPAVNLAITAPTWPVGTSNSTNCGSTLAAGDSCTVTVTPGSTATANNSSTPCSNGTAPVPQVLQIGSDNSNSLSVNVLVLNYGCIYQGGLIYAFDDTTPDSGSVGGKIATTTDQSNGIIWSSDGGGSTFPNSRNDSIYGITETSTSSSPNPSGGQVAGQSACNGATDGACNTNNIYVYYENFASGAPVNLSFYATGLCKQMIAGYSDWYLPAICELGYRAAGNLSGCGTSATPTLQNMRTALGSILNSVSAYWSSTESAADPVNYAWYNVFSNGTQANNNNKFGEFRVRCSRRLDY